MALATRTAQAQERLADALVFLSCNSQVEVEDLGSTLAFKASKLPTHWRYYGYLFADGTLRVRIGRLVGGRVVEETHEMDAGNTNMHHLQAYNDTVRNVRNLATS